MRYSNIILFILFIFAGCSGVNSADSNSNNSLPDNVPGSVSITIPDVLLIDSTYTIPISISDKDTLRSIMLKEELNSEISDSIVHFLSTPKWDTTLTRRFNKTGEYMISVAATDRYPKPGQVDKSVSAEITATLEEREISFTLTNSVLETKADGVNVSIFDANHNVITEGKINNGSFTFTKKVSEGSTWYFQVEFSDLGYIDISKEIGNAKSQNYIFPIDPAPIEINNTLPTLSPGSSKIIDLRDYVDSKDPDDGQSIPMEQMELSTQSNNLTVTKQDKFTYQLTLANDAASLEETAILKASSAYNSSSKTVTIPVSSEGTITQDKDQINGRQGTSVEFQLSDYFSSTSTFTTVQFTSSAVTIEDLGNRSYMLSQPDNLTGTEIIGVLLINEADDTLETELKYNIASSSSGDELVIMPLGDSITNDSRSRVKLWNLLVADNYSVDYVGSQQQASSIPDPDHEGVGGITIQGIATKAASLMQNYQPKYVNLMVGTNDIAWYFDETGQEIADRWNNLVQIIFDNSDPGTYIIAATIPPEASQMVGKSDMPDRDRAHLVADFNAALREHVAERKQAGDLIVLADMEEAMNVNTDVGNDGVHLNSSGYAIMGTVYYEAILSILAGN